MSQKARKNSWVGQCCWGIYGMLKLLEGKVVTYVAKVRGRIWVSGQHKFRVHVFHRNWQSLESRGSPWLHHRSIRGRLWRKTSQGMRWSTPLKDSAVRNKIKLWWRHQQRRPYITAEYSCEALMTQTTSRILDVMDTVREKPYMRPENLGWPKHKTADDTTKYCQETVMSVKFAVEGSQWHARES